MYGTPFGSAKLSSLRSARIATPHNFFLASAQKNAALADAAHLRGARTRQEPPMPARRELSEGTFFLRGGEVSVNLNSFPRRFIFRRFARAEKGLHAGAPGKIGNRA